MSIKQEQAPQLNQELQISQQQIQSLEILALNQQELNSFLQKELEFNPTLEIDEFKTDKPISFKDTYTISNAKKDFFLNSLIKQESLQEKLIQQLDFFQHTEQEIKLAKEIIYNLSDSGILDCSLKEIAQDSPYTISDWEKALLIVQELEPKGVGARNLKEVLLLQVKDIEGQNSLTYTVIENYLDLIKKNNLPLIAKKLNTKINTIYKVLEKIKQLNPSPASQITELNPHDFVVPDIFIEYNKEKQQIKVFFDKDNINSLKISDYYLKLNKSKKLDKKSKKYLKEKLSDAKALISSIEKRMRTLHKIAVFLAHYHSDFFSKKSQSLKILNMKKIKEEINLHESTISRAIKNKYIKCSQGLLPFKFFISSSSMTTKTDEADRNIKDIISLVINNEDKYKPLSDEKISKIIAEDHKIVLARRTVTKYRQKLGFQSTKMRKLFK